MNERSLKLLVVDDDSTNLALMQNIFKNSYTLVFAKNGPDALRHAQQQPDLILLDVSMPIMSGHEVCELLQADEKTKNIPIIFVTALGGEEDEIKGLSLGAVDYISKPILPAVVRARVKNHLALRKWK